MRTDALIDNQLDIPFFLFTFDALIVSCEFFWGGCDEINRKAPPARGLPCALGFGFCIRELSGGGDLCLCTPALKDVGVENRDVAFPCGRGHRGWPFGFGCKRGQCGCVGEAARACCCRAEWRYTTGDIG